MTTAPAEQAPQSRTFFDTEDLKSDLKGRSVRGGAATVLGQGASFVIRTGSTMVLARLLTPADFGLIAMVTAVVGFATLFKDLGLSMATVQRAEVNHGQISTLFWLNVAFSVAIALVLAACAPAIAWFYGEPRLTWVTLALAVGLILGGLTVQHQAVLRRQIRFAALAVIQVVAMLTGAVAAIVAAVFGAGYWSLVVMQLASTLVTALAIWGVCGWRPGPPVRRSGVRDMLKFGGNLTGFNIVNYFARNVDNVLIGRVWGPVELGLYAKAYGLFTLPLRQLTYPISSVAIPALSRMQGDRVRYRRAFFSVQEKLCILIVPLIAFLAGTSDWVIEVVLGPAWLPASQIFRWLSIAGLAQAVISTVGWLFVTQDRTRDMLKWGVIGSGLTIASFVLGLKWGALGVAISYSLSGILIRTPLLIWFVGRKGMVSARDLWRCVLPYLALGAFLAGAVGLLSFGLTPYLAPWQGLCVAGVSYLVLLLAVVLLFSRVRHHVVEMLSWTRLGVDRDLAK